MSKEERTRLFHSIGMHSKAAVQESSGKVRLMTMKQVIAYLVFTQHFREKKVSELNEILKQKKEKCINCGKDKLVERIIEVWPWQKSSAAHRSSTDSTLHSHKLHLKADAKDSSSKKMLHHAIKKHMSIKKHSSNHDQNLFDQDNHGKPKKLAK